MIEYLHTIINIFAGGRSEIKVYLFLVYVVALLCVTLYKKRLGKSDLTQSSHLLYFFSSIALLFAIGLSTHFYLLHQFQIGWDEFAVFFNNGEISSTSMWHTHVLKGAMALVITFFSTGIYQGVDTGTVFLGLIPSWIFLASLIILATALYFSLKAYRNMDTSSFDYKRHALFIIGYAIFSFSLLKNTIDGGILNTETIPSLIGLYLLCGTSVVRQRIGIFILVATLMMLGIADAILVIMKKNINVDFSMPHLVGMLALASFFSYLSLYIHRRPFSKRLLALFFVLLLIASFASSERDRNLKKYEALSLADSSGVFVASKDVLSDDHFELQESVGALSVYKPKGGSGIDRVEDVTKLLNAPANFQPVSVPYVTCVPEAPFNAFSFTLVTNHPDPFVSFTGQSNSRFYRIVQINEVSSSSYEVTMELHPCLGREVEFIQEIFAQSGLHSFVIYNLKAEQRE